VNKISVIIPTLQKNLEVLIQLVSTLEKDLYIDEILIINNSSKEINLNNNNKIKIINLNSNIYVNPAWNLGVTLAQNELIALLNDDILLPYNFFTNFIHTLPNNFGVIGISTKYIKSIEKCIENPKEEKPIIDRINYRCFGYGICMLLCKSSYIEIPDSIKIMYGDDWLFHKCKKQGKQNFCITGQTVYHIGSLTSAINTFNPIIKKDGHTYKKMIVKWYHRIFSFEELQYFYKFRLLGITFKIKKKVSKGLL